MPMERLVGSQKRDEVVCTLTAHFICVVSTANKYKPILPSQGDIILCCRITKMNELFKAGKTWYKDAK